MNRLKRLGLSTLLATGLGIAVYASPSVPLYAQEDEGQEIFQELSTLNSIGEGENRVLSSNWQSISTDEQHIYRFDYEGDEQPINVWLNAVPADGAEFEIWTEDALAQVDAGEDVDSIGTGTPIEDIEEGAGFKLWQGSSPDAESYFVVVTSGDAEDAQYLLNITSPGLALTQTAASALTPFTPPATTDATSSVTSVVTAPVTSVVTSVITSPVTSTVTLPITESTTATGTAAVTSTAVVTPADGEAVTVTPTVGSNIATVTTDALNVREGPSTAFPIIMTVLSGTELSVLGRNATNTWLNVEVEEGVEGWVTRLLTDYSGIAVISATPVLTPTVAADTATETGDTDDTGTDDTGADDTGTDEDAIPGENVSLPDAEPQEALDDDWQVLSGGETRWYTFQHQGGELPVHIWMDVEPNENAGFRILSEENAQAVMAGTAPDDVENIGRGTPNEDEGGYLFWRGVFAEAGTFYVMVEQFDEGTTFYSIHAAGPGLSRPVPTE